LVERRRRGTEIPETSNVPFLGPSFPLCADPALTRRAISRRRFAPQFDVCQSSNTLLSPSKPDCLFAE